MHQVGNCSLGDLDSQLEFLIKMYFKEHGIPHFHALDKHGYGIVWNDELDLSESELWINGLPAE